MPGTCQARLGPLGLHHADDPGNPDSAETRAVPSTARLKRAMPRVPNRPPGLFATPNSNINLFFNH